MKNNVEERPLGANFPAVSWENPEEIQHWLTALEEQTDELSAALRDRLHKKRDRVLSRHEAKRQSAAAARSIAQLFRAAKAGLNLPDATPEPPDASEEGEPPQSERRPAPTSPGAESG